MNTFLQHIWENKVTFFGTFFIIFSLTYIVMVAIDFLPEEPAQSDVEADEVSEAVPENVIRTNQEQESLVPEEEISDIEPVLQERAELPQSISIKKLDKTIVVLNPQSRNIADLDTALLDGVVRHPDSATLTQEGNVFILGHSSYLPNVFNKNFQAFNGIQNLEWGDIIEVTSADTVYEYRVEKVYRARAQDVTVPIADTGSMLTLATCNSFGSVDDRYIVEAKQTGKRAL
jgi:LPXTG-site transpeptidase (sortase) family protein